jgi:hypothetical protein
MSTYRPVIRFGMRAVALLGILPGAIVAAAYLLVLTEQLYHQWDPRTAVVLGMAAWGVLGVIALWHEYVRLSQTRVGAERMPVSPRALLFVWALLLLAIAGWKGDTHPWVASFLALVALYSFGRACGLLRYVARPPAASGRANAARTARFARARGGARSRARSSPARSRPRASN